MEWKIGVEKKAQELSVVRKDLMEKKNPAMYPLNNKRNEEKS